MEGNGEGNLVRREGERGDYAEREHIKQSDNPNRSSFLTEICRTKHWLLNSLSPQRPHEFRNGYITKPQNPWALIAGTDTKQYTSRAPDPSGPCFDTFNLYNSCTPLVPSTSSSKYGMLSSSSPPPLPQLPLRSSPFGEAEAVTKTATEAKTTKISTGV